MNAMLDRWKHWSGTANDAVAEAELALAGTGIEAPNRRNFDNYVAKSCIEPAAGKGAYGRRQILQAAAVRILLKDGWPLERIADFNRNATDKALADLVATAIDRTRIAPDKAAYSATTDAMAAILRLRQDSGLAPDPSRQSHSPTAWPRLSIDPPIGLSVTPAAAQLREASDLGLETAGFAAAVSGPPSATPIRRSEPLAYAIDGIALTVDRAAAPRDRDTFIRLARLMIDHAADDLFEKKDDTK